MYDNENGLQSAENGYVTKTRYLGMPRGFVTLSKARQSPPPPRQGKETPLTLGLVVPRWLCGRGFISFRVWQKECKTFHQLSLFIVRTRLKESLDHK